MTDSYALMPRQSSQSGVGASASSSSNSRPILKINKNDAKFLTKVQIKKAQFLFEHDYFIWNEAEMYLRYHDLFAALPNSDVLYENVCKTTRIVFNLIHDVHFAGTGSNAAHLKFFEVLDAWGALSEYLKQHDRFPQPLMEWFNSIFQIYQMRDEFGERIVPFEALLRLYLVSGLENRHAIDSYALITSSKKYKLTFERIVELFKYIIVSSEMKHFSYALVPKMQETLLQNTKEKRPEEVLRNYDYEMNNLRKSNNNLTSLYSNLSEWKTKEITTIPVNQMVKGDRSIYSYHSKHTFENKIMELKVVENENFEKSKSSPQQQGGSSKQPQQPQSQQKQPQPSQKPNTDQTQTNIQAKITTTASNKTIIPIENNTENNNNKPSSISDITNVQSSVRPKTPTPIPTTNKEEVKTTAIETVVKKEETQTTSQPPPPPPPPPLPLLQTTKSGDDQDASSKPQKVIMKRGIASSRQHKSLTRQSVGDVAVGFHISTSPPPPPPLVATGHFKESSTIAEIKKKLVGVGLVADKVKSGEGVIGGAYEVSSAKSPNRREETTLSKALPTSLQPPVTGVKRLSGSVNELDRSGIYGLMACNSFKMSEFKREFKRFNTTLTTTPTSGELIGHTLSKSINTLDKLSGNNSRYQPTSGVSHTTSNTDVQSSSTTTTTSQSGNARQSTNTGCTIMNDKTNNTSFSHNDLRTLPSYESEFPAQQQQQQQVYQANNTPQQQIQELTAQSQSTQRISKTKNKVYTRIKNQQQQQQEKQQLSQTMPHLNSDSLNNSLSDEVGGDDTGIASNTTKRDASESQQHPASSSSFFLHDKSMTSTKPSKSKVAIISTPSATSQPKRPSSASNDRSSSTINQRHHHTLDSLDLKTSGVDVGLKTDEIFSERSNMTSMSCNNPNNNNASGPRFFIDGAMLRKESRLLSLSSSFLSSSNESSSDKTRYLDTTATQKPTTPTLESHSNRRQIQFDDEAVKVRKQRQQQQHLLSPNNFFPNLSSFSSSDGSNNVNKYNTTSPIRNNMSSKQMLKMYSGGMSTPATATSLEKQQRPSSSLKMYSPKDHNQQRAIRNLESPLTMTTASCTTASRRSSTPKTAASHVVTAAASDDSSKASWLVNYGTYASNTVKPNEAFKICKSSNYHEPHAHQHHHKHHHNRRRHHKSPMSSSSSNKRVVDLNLSVPVIVGKDLDERKSKNLFKLNKTLHEQFHDDLEMNSEKQVKNRYSVCESLKATQSYGIVSEPLKSIVHAITLSSLDTLNDIDSENSNHNQQTQHPNETESETEAAATATATSTTRSMGALIDMPTKLSAVGQKELSETDDDDDVPLDEVAAVSQAAYEQLSDRRRRRHPPVPFDEDDDDDDDDDDEYIQTPHHDDSLNHKSPHRNRHNQGSIERHHQRDYYYSTSTQHQSNQPYNHHNHHQSPHHRSRRRKHSSGQQTAQQQTQQSPQQMKSSTPQPLPQYLDQQQLKNIHQMLEQDWSYSQNSNNTYSYSATNNNQTATNTATPPLPPFTAALDTQKIINEIVRKLKPYIIKCVRKEVRTCFDRYQHRKESSSTQSATHQNVKPKYNPDTLNSSLTKIGDF